MAKKESEIEQTINRGFSVIGHSVSKLLVFIVVVLFCLLVTKNSGQISEKMEFEGLMKLAPLLVWLIPFALLMVYGQENTAGAKDLFVQIGFKNREGITPTQIAKYRNPAPRKIGGNKNVDYEADRKKMIYRFKSPGIPLTRWIEEKQNIENALNSSILTIREDPNDRQIIELVTIPSQYRLPISTRDNPFWWDDKYTTKDEAEVVVGMGVLKKHVVDLNKFPHMLVAGQTGSGKSVIVQSVLWQLVKKGARPYVIDFKGGIEFGGDWENYGEVVTELDDALDLIQRLAIEQEQRFRHLRDDGVEYNYDAKNIKAYNKKHPDNPLSRIILVVDEAGDLLNKEGADKENKAKITELSGLISSLAMKSRAVGINMIIGIQRPDAQVLTGQIRNNVPIKICGRCMGGDGRYLSEMVLGDSIATTIDPEIEGRFYGNLGTGLTQFQSYYFEPKKFLQEGEFRKGHCLVLDKEKPKDEPEFYEPIEEEEEIDWASFGKK